LKLVQLETKLGQKILAVLKDPFHLLDLTFLKVIFVKFLDAMQHDRYGLDSTAST
jgi:hypothetical protein